MNKAYAKAIYEIAPYRIMHPTQPDHGKPYTFSRGDDGQSVVYHASDGNAHPLGVGSREQHTVHALDIENLLAKPLDPFEVWMVKQNVEYVKTEGIDVVVSRLRQGGYNRVGQAVEEHCRVEKIAAV